MNAQRVARGYDLLARVYDGLAMLVYGRALRRAQTCMLRDLPRGAAVLVLGGGSGWFLEQLLREAAPAQVVYVELSGQMLALAQRRIARRLPALAERVAWVQGRAEDVDLPGQMQVVVTHCLLDMFAQPDLEALVGSLGRSLRPGGSWYFSDFRQVPHGPMRPVSAALLWLMYRFFRAVCGIAARRLPDFERAFAQHGLAVMAEQQFFGGMIVARRYAVQSDPK